LRFDLQHRNHEKIERYNGLNLVSNLLELMEYDLSHFDYKLRYGYLLNAIIYLYRSNSFNEILQKEIIQKIQLIRILIQQILYHISPI